MQIKDKLQQFNSNIYWTTINWGLANKHMEIHHLGSLWNALKNCTSWTWWQTSWTGDFANRHRPEHSWCHNACSRIMTDRISILWWKFVILAHLGIQDMDGNKTAGELKRSSSNYTWVVYFLRCLVCIFSCQFIASCGNLASWGHGHPSWNLFICPI